MRPTRRALAPVCLGGVLVLSACAPDGERGDSPSTTVERSDQPSSDAEAGTGATTATTGRPVASVAPTSDVPPPTVPASTTEPPPAIVDVREPPGESDDFVGARDDVRVDRCELNGELTTASGTVTNPSDSDAGYRIYVAFNEEGNAVSSALIQVDIEVTAGSTESWEAEAPVVVAAPVCILRVERIDP